MKIITTSSGKQEVRLSKSEWEAIGKKAGWVKEAAMSEEQWNALDPMDRRTKARRTLSRAISGRIGMGLEDLPDTPEIQIDNWWDESMSLSETIDAIREAANEICSNLEENGMGSDFF